MNVRISFHGLDSSEALAEHINDLAADLDGERFSSCRVVVEAPHRHHRKGRVFHVRVELAVPGRRIVADADRERHQDPYLAANDAFEAVQRKWRRHRAA